jgi:hypothetical protein
MLQAAEPYFRGISVAVPSSLREVAGFVSRRAAVASPGLTVSDTSGQSRAGDRIDKPT